MTLRAKLFPQSDQKIIRILSLKDDDEDNEYDNNDFDDIYTWHYVQSCFPNLQKIIRILSLKDDDEDDEVNEYDNNMTIWQKTIRILS